MKLFHTLRTAVLPLALFAPLVCCVAPTAIEPFPEESSNAADEALAKSRTSTVVTEINNANAGLSAAARAEKYAAMKASPAAFFRRELRR